MPTRLALLFSIILVSPLAAQQQPQTNPATIQSRANHRIDWHQQMQSSAATDTAAHPATPAQLAGQDAQQLSALAVSVYPELQQLQKGVVSKDLTDKLKTMEKLSKKLRHDLGQ